MKANKVLWIVFDEYNDEVGVFKTRQDARENIKNAKKRNVEGISGPYKYMLINNRSICVDPSNVYIEYPYMQASRWHRSQAAQKHTT